MRPSWVYARHEADLMIDEDKRRVSGSQGFVKGWFDVAYN
jgi:hypothetical protein